VAVGSSLTRGQSFARAVFIRGGATSQQQSAMLFADYVSALQPAGWPWGRTVNPIEGPGWRHSVQVANPAAGVDWSLVCGASQRLTPISFSATFAAAVAAGNRAINIIVDDGANIVWQDDLGVNVTASQTVSVNGSTAPVATGITATQLFVTIPPGTILAAPWRVRSSTGGIQAADQWSNIWFQVDDQLENV
jgi:hypothetical protein